MSISDFTIKTDHILLTEIAHQIKRKLTTALNIKIICNDKVEHFCSTSEDYLFSDIF